MIHVYLASDNAMNYLVIRDMDRDDKDAAIIDWDLDDHEVEWSHSLYLNPENDGDIIKACAVCNPEWEPFDDIMARMNQFENLNW